MGLLETFRTAIESLTTNKLRTALTMLGVIIGVMSVVLLLALGAGVQKFINDTLATAGTNQLFIFPDNSVAGARLTMEDYKAIADPANVPGLKRIVPRVSGNLKASAGIASKNSEIVGTLPEDFTMRLLTIEQGAHFTNSDVDTRRRVAVLGHQAAQDLFPNQIALGLNVLVDGVPFRVVGVNTKKGTQGPGNEPDRMIFVPLTIAQETLFANRPGGVKALSQITAEAVSTEATAAALDNIGKTLRKRQGLLVGQKDTFRVIDQASFISTVNTVLVGLQGFLAAVGGISLLVGGIGIMNIMLVSVTERTREIGVRKAIGADPGAIRLQFLVESLVVTMFAGSIGVGVAAGLAAIIGAAQDSIEPQIQFTAVAIAFGVSVFIGAVFGFYPAFRASKLPPVEALRYE
jgi:putative ABC transport system permease protein